MTTENTSPVEQVCPDCGMIIRPAVDLDETVVYCCHNCQSDIEMRKDDACDLQ